MTPLLRINALSGGYGATRVLREVTLSVDRREIVTLIGANGAGKTTLLNTIMGILPATGGDIGFDGARISGIDTGAIVRQGLALVPERRQLFDEMTVEENLRMGSYARDDRDEARADLAAQYLRFPRLAERRAQRTRSLSGGEQQMVAVARAMMSRPQLLLLDEPSLGLAPLLVARIMEMIVEFRDGGGTVLLVEQNARAALEIADRGYVIETGRVILSGSSSELLANPALVQAYLGVDEHMEKRIREEKARVRGEGWAASR